MSATLDALDVLVVTVVHDPEDARIRHRQVRALAHAGHRVTLAAPLTAYDRDPPDDIAWVDLPRAVGRRRVRSTLSAVRLLHRVGRSFDVVVLHDPELLVAALVQPRLRRRTAVVWDVHEDTAAALSLKPWLPGVARRVLPALVHVGERVAERSVHLLLAEAGYAGRFRRRHPVVPNTVLVPAADPPPSGDGRLVYVGRLNRARGALEMVDLGRRVAGRLRVELFGPADADVAAELERADRDGAVRWHGFVPNDRALPSLEGATAGLSLLHDEPNYAHSMPTKLMEYMSRGIPVVTTPNAASVDLVERYRCGVVVPFDDAAAAAAEVALRLQSDAVMRDRLAAAGRAAATRELDWARDGPAFVAQLAAWAAEHGRARVAMQ